MTENEQPVCPCCMRRHELRVMRRMEANLWKGLCLRYEAEYFWCTEADVYFADERMIRKNHKAIDQRGVHLSRVRERAVAVADDIGMTQMQVRCIVDQSFSSHSSRPTISPYSPDE